MAQKTPLRKWKSNPQNGKNVSKSCSDKGLVFKVNKELLTLTIKRQISKN